MSMCIGKNNVSVIFAMIIMMNDDVHNIYVFIGLYQKGILLFTSNNDQYTIHMYVYSTSTSTVHCTVQSVSLFFARLDFIGGGA